MWQRTRDKRGDRVCRLCLMEQGELEGNRAIKMQSGLGGYGGKHMG